MRRVRRRRSVALVVLSCAILLSGQFSGSAGASAPGHARNWPHAFDASGVAYVGSTDNHVYGLDAITGEVLWNATLGEPIQFRQPVVEGGHVYAAADKLYVFGLP